MRLLICLFVFACIPYAFAIVLIACSFNFLQVCMFCLCFLAFFACAFVLFTCGLFFFRTCSFFAFVLRVFALALIACSLNSSHMHVFSSLVHAFIPRARLLCFHIHSFYFRLSALHTRSL